MVLGEPVQEGSQGRGWKMPLEKSAEHGREKRRLPWIWSLGATADFGVGGRGCSQNKRVFLRLQEEWTVFWAGSTKPEEIITQQSRGQRGR